MSKYEEQYEEAMEQTTSHNWEPPPFDRSKRKKRWDPPLSAKCMEIAGAEDIYCWHCNKCLNPDEFYYCFDCLEDCWAYWGA